MFYHTQQKFTTLGDAVTASPKQKKKKNCKITLRQITFYCAYQPIFSIINYNLLKIKSHSKITVKFTHNNLIILLPH